MTALGRLIGHVAGTGLFVPKPTDDVLLTWSPWPRRRDEQGVTTSGAQRRRRRLGWIPIFPPDNELPVALDVGPFVWRSAGVGITATGFLVYSTGVLFKLIALSKGVTLSAEDPLGQFAGDREHFGLMGEQPAGALQLGVRGVPVTSHSTNRNENRLNIEAWAPFLPEGDLVIYLEWPAVDIEYSEFRIPRSAAAKAIVLWPAESP